MFFAIVLSTLFISVCSAAEAQLEAASLSERERIMQELRADLTRMLEERGLSLEQVYPGLAEGVGPALANPGQADEGDFINNNVTLLYASDGTVSLHNNKRRGFPGIDRKNSRGRKKGELAVEKKCMFTVTFTKEGNKFKCPECGKLFSSSYKRIISDLNLRHSGCFINVQEDGECVPACGEVLITQQF